MSANNKKSYSTWNNAERMALIEGRIKNNEDFISKNANMNQAWKKLAEELSGKLMGKDHINCKSQWNSLLRKYKSFSRYKTGEGTGCEATGEDPNDWEFYGIIHAYASQKDNFYPPFVIDSTRGAFSMRAGEESEATNEPSISTPQRDNRNQSTASRSGSNKKQKALKRLEKRAKRRDKKFNSMLAVFGQMVQTDYPNIDVSGLLVASSASDSE